jgi:hypothetical protein
VKASLAQFRAAHAFLTPVGGFAVRLVRGRTKHATPNHEPKPSAPALPRSRSASPAPRQTFDEYLLERDGEPPVFSRDEEEERGVPIAHATKLNQELMKVEPGIEGGADGLTVYGSELMTQIAIPPTLSGVGQNIPRGGLFTVLPNNPMFGDGLRLTKILQTFDQFQIERMTYEYVPFCAATQAGGLIMSTINDVDEADTLQSGGFPAMRDAMTRAGAVTFNVYTGAACSMGTSLLPWYYTGANEDPNFDQPGQTLIMAATDYNSPGTAGVALGLVWAHYVIKVRAPSIERNLVQTFSSAGPTIVTMSGAAGSSPIQFAPVVLRTSTLTGLPAGNAQTGSICWATVTAFDDAAFGSAAWRTWVDPSTQITVLISAGTIIYWRTWFTAGDTAFTGFYPTFAAASDASAAPDGAYLTSVAWGLLLKSLSFINFSGTTIGGGI